SWCPLLLNSHNAHSKMVSCLALAKHSGRLLATGGEDCSVNIWSISKANCIMSLTGHKNPVECVEINSTDEQVVTGSQSGSVRVWDLEAAKILRTLMGHRTSITSLSCHPFGEYIASSSMDMNIKLWDVRRKGYVFSFSGHTEAVRSLAFSPDGKWLASAGDDCSVKLWDLAQGKVIKEFRSHTAAVHTVQFHPNEYLLASGGSDRTIKLWDLEKFTMIGSLEGNTTPVRCMLFSPDGCCLYSGATDCLRVFGWEPDRCFDVVSVGWEKVSDLAVCNQQLIAASHHLSTVSSYVVDLKRVKKSGGSVIQGIIQDNQPLTEPKDPKGATIRRSYERPTTTCSRLKQRSDADRRSPEGERQSPSEEEADEKLSSAEIHNAEDYKEIFQPKNAICRWSAAITPEHLDTELQIHLLYAAQPVTSTPVQRVEPTVVSNVKRPSVVGPPSSSQNPPQPPVITAKQKPQQKIILSTRNEPIGLNVSDFLPVTLSDDEAVTQIKKGHDTMCVMLSSRHKNLETVRAVWVREDVKVRLSLPAAHLDQLLTVDTPDPIITIIITTIWSPFQDILQSSKEHK
uniref:WDR36/Utp21 N-terminal domain-containing protein n=1 Tax=Amphiprion ocellaris TaxID=80972 RepID=A0AAQ6AJK4_AMPOC